MSTWLPASSLCGRLWKKLLRLYKNFACKINYFTNIIFIWFYFIFKTWGEHAPLGEYFSMMWGMAYRRSSHNVYGIEYHIVFCTKYRYRALYDNIAEKCIEVMKKVCSANYVDIISENVSSDHVHRLSSMPPHLHISRIIQYIKGKSSRKLRREFQRLRKRYCSTYRRENILS